MSESAAEAFDVARFAHARAEQGLAWGDPCHYLPETGSTNDDALEAARRGAPEGSLFIADFQRLGRGRQGRRWLAAPGQSLLFSILLRPEASVTPGAALTLAVGLGVRAALAAESRAPLSVKWPNDVLAEGRKLAGILCEGQLRGSSVEALVIGVGINWGAQAFPPELAPETVCLVELAGGNGAAIAGGRERLLADILAAIERRVRAYLEHGASCLLPEFRSVDALFGRRVQVSGASELAGSARGVDDEGRLLVESEGVLIAIHSGTVRALD
ncbi:MAG TPA: biotin--[acetyl-CoA-carboxylase] ligase [Polyangiaceae bacterium]|nr:biotin--[acetyl-CoA-carboxylase] ligase [Polyangiaceae bacterium]